MLNAIILTIKNIKNNKTIMAPINKAEQFSPFVFHLKIAVYTLEAFKIRFG